MSNNENITRLQAERQRLNAKKAELEASLQNDWETIQEGMNNGSFIRETLKSFLLRKIYNPKFAGDAFVAGTARIATEFAERVEAFVIAQLEKFIQFIERKMEGWFRSNDAPTEENEEDTV